MSEVPIFYQGEVMLLNWNENDASGRTVVFQLDDHDARHPFKGQRRGTANGQRFKIVLVALGDDDEPINAKKTTGPDIRGDHAAPGPTPDDAAQGQGKPRQSFRGLKKSAQVALKCQESEFYQWLTRHPEFNEVTRELTGTPTDAEVADLVVKRICKISSKRELDTDVVKGKIWDGLLTDYDYRNCRA